MLGSIHTKTCTLNDGQEDDDDKEEEGDVEQDAVELVGISSWILQLVSDSSSSPHAHVHVEQVTLQRDFSLQLHVQHFSIQRWMLTDFFLKRV